MRDLMSKLPGSLVREIANANMGRAGVIPLWFGESDLPTDSVVRDAAAASLTAGETFYGPNLGLAPLREAIAGYERTWFPQIDQANIVVTSSGLNGLLLSLMATVEAGDEVVTLSPSWPNIVAMPSLLGATVRTVPLRLSGGRFRLDLDELFDAIGDRTRAVLINTPHNPTGWAMPAEDIAIVAEELDRRGIWLIADGVYGRLFAGADHAPSFLDMFDDQRRIIGVDSFSKSFSMTGWRLGWLVAPRSAVPVFEKLVEFDTSCAPAFVQRGGIAALADQERLVATQRRALAASREVVIEKLSGLEGVTLPDLGAAFYAFPRIEGIDDIAFARRAVAETGVGIAPGTAFGEEGRGHIRICYAREPVSLRAALDRLVPLLHDVTETVDG